MPPGIGATLAQYGVLGAMVLWFMWVDKGRRDQDKELQIRQEQRQSVQDERLERVLAAVNNLTRATLLDVLNRPEAMNRAKEEARQMLDAIGKK